jgi:hypothetical protein
MHVLSFIRLSESMTTAFLISAVAQHTDLSMFAVNGYGSGDDVANNQFSINLKRSVHNSLLLFDEVEALGKCFCLLALSSDAF